MRPKDCTSEKNATYRSSRGRDFQSPTTARDSMSPAVLSLLASILDVRVVLSTDSDRENAWRKARSLPMMRDKVTKAKARVRWTARSLNRAPDTCNVKPKPAAIRKGNVTQKYRTSTEW